MDKEKPSDPATSKGAENPEKPLGRGLEQISHLFLTQRLGDARPPNPSVTRMPEPSAPPTPARLDTRPILLRPNTSMTRARFVAILREFLGSLEEGLRVIDVFLQCHPHGEIDLLALDRANQLTIIDFDTGLNDGLVIRGLAHCEWLKQNLPNVRRMHSGHTLQLSNPPRLFVLAPRFSALAMSAACQLSQPQIHWVRYQVFDTGSATGIFFEPADTVG